MQTYTIYIDELKSDVNEKCSNQSNFDKSNNVRGNRNEFFLETNIDSIFW